MAVFKLYKGKRITSRDKNWSKGRWYFWGRLNGRAVQKALKYAQTKEEAEQAAREIVRQAFDKRYGLGDNTTTFKDFAFGTYLQYVEQKNVNKAAKRHYVRLLCNVFRSSPLATITPQDCRNCQATLRRTTSDSSVNRIMSTASKIFSLACEEGILDRNPMQYVKSLKEPPPRNRLLKTEEREELWCQLQTDPLLFRLITLAVNLPLRRGQILAITPDAVDLQNGLLYVISSKGRDARWVPLNTTAQNTLQAMLTDGQIPFPLKDFRRRWKRILISAGINKKGGKRGDNFTFHDLRKEFASELIRKNVNPNIVQKLFAHSDMSITNVYMHAEQEQLFEAVKRLDEVQEIGGEQ